jgi:hypothetical protein
MTKIKFKKNLGMVSNYTEFDADFKSVEETAKNSIKSLP